MANQSKLKAWLRYDGTGRVVTAGPIFQANKPKVGNWRQMNIDLCCNPSGSTTTTTTAGGSTATAWTIRLFSSEQNACAYMFSNSAIGYTASSTIGQGTTIWADAALTIQFDPQGYQYIKLEGDANVYTVFYAASITVINGIVNCNPPSSFYGYAANSSSQACQQTGGNPGVTLYASSGAQLGLNTQLFFDSGLTVPYEGQYGGWFSVNGTAYATGTGGYIISVITCSQSFIARRGNSFSEACSGQTPNETFYSPDPLYFNVYPQNGITVYLDDALTQPVPYCWMASPGIGQVFECVNAVLFNGTTC